MHFHVPWIVYTWHHLIQQGMFMTTNSWVQDVVHPPMASGAQRLHRMKRRSGTEFATPYHLTIEHMWPFMLIARDSRDKVKANQGSCLPISPQECQATLHQATEGRREVVCHWSLSAEGITLRLGDCVSQRLAPAHFQIQGPPVAPNYIPWSIWRSLCLMWQFLWFELWPLCLKLFHFSMF